MTTDARNLLLKIARCQNFFAAATDRFHPCHKIVTNRDQPKPPKGPHLPEPWCGDIENADVLFVSSNPSIDPDEKFPTTSWPDVDIVDFFVNRFNDSNYKNMC